MKKMILSTGVLLALLTSCKTSQVSSFSDDIYANPAEEKQLARQAEDAKAKKRAEERAQEEADRAAQKAKDDANPYYQDPKSDADDYYDYKYASRLNRFSDPIPGAGYYDSRYTNYYTYNQNPAMFGSSIYSSYNWMPSSQFGYYSSGISMGFGTGYGYGGYGMYNNPMTFGNPYAYNYYNPYGYNNFGYGYYDPFYMGYGNSAYSAGYYNGFYSGYNSGWGYLNSYDANSGYSQVKGPRGSNGGGNSRRTTTAGMDTPGAASERTAFLNSMADKQASSPRFTETARSSRGSNMGSNGNTDQQSMSPRNPSRGGDLNGGTPVGGNNNGTSANPRENSSRRVGEAREVTPNQNNQNSSRNASPVFENNSSGGGGGGRSGGSSGGSSSPRGGGGGGNRPR